MNARVDVLCRGLLRAFSAFVCPGAGNLESERQENAFAE